MSAIHTKSAAIFNGLLINEANEKIQDYWWPCWKEKKRCEALMVKDLIQPSFREYLISKSKYHDVYGEDDFIMPVNNVEHSMWNGVDITMNG